MIRIALLAVSMLAAAASSAAAQAGPARLVADPQAYVAEQSRGCIKGLGACLTATFVDAFGPTVGLQQSIVVAGRVFEDERAQKWTIVSDSQLGDVVRWIFVVHTTEKLEGVSMRYEFHRVSDQWRVMDISFNTRFVDVLIPIPPGAVPIPIVHAHQPTR